MENAFHSIINTSVHSSLNTALTGAETFSGDAATKLLPNALRIESDGSASAANDVKRVRRYVDRIVSAFLSVSTSAKPWLALFCDAVGGITAAPRWSDASLLVAPRMVGACFNAGLSAAHTEPSGACLRHRVVGATDGILKCLDARLEEKDGSVNIIQ